MIVESKTSHETIFKMKYQLESVKVTKVKLKAL